MKGFVHVYTGNGKGKTTAALGLAIRAAGSGKNVFIAQFVKGKAYSEHSVLKQLGIEYALYGRGCFIRDDPTTEDINAAKDGFKRVRKKVISGTYDLVVLDEITIAIHFHLISIGDVIDLIQERPAHTELILTGRYAPEQILEVADLVTEMQEKKHYYVQGIQAREGIEF